MRTFLCILLGLLVCAWAQEPERSWPTEISADDTAWLFGKINETLAEYKTQQKKVSISLVNGKVVYGVVERVGDDKCSIKDSDGKLNLVRFQRIKAKSMSKLVSSKYHNERFLYNLGILFFYDKEFAYAESYFQRAVQQGNTNASTWLTKTKETSGAADVPSDTAPVEETPTAAKPPEQPSTATPAKPEKKPRASLKLPKVINLKATRRIDFAAYTEPGYYTIFEFYAEWCNACKQIVPQVDAMVEKSPQVVLRKIDIKDWGSAVVSQSKISYIPFFIVFNPDGKEEYRGGTEKVMPSLRKWQEEAQQE